MNQEQRISAEQSRPSTSAGVWGLRYPGLVMGKGGKNEVKEFTGMWRLKLDADLVRCSMKTFMRTALMGLALVGSGCMLFVDKETPYLKAAQDRATQQEVRERLGVPWQTASTPGGETVWVYAVREEHPGSRYTSPGMWCDEYVLTFDHQGVLRRWTHKSQLHGGKLRPMDCVDNGFKPIS